MQSERVEAARVAAERNELQVAVEALNAQLESARAAAAEVGQKVAAERAHWKSVGPGVGAEDRRRLRILEKKYKLAKQYLENYKQAHRKLREQVESAAVARSERTGASRREASGRRRLLEHENSRLLLELRRRAQENEELARRAKRERRSAKSQPRTQNLEIERSKNQFLAQENRKLQARIQELNLKYRSVIDDVNSRRVERSERSALFFRTRRGNGESDRGHWPGKPTGFGRSGETRDETDLGGGAGSLDSLRLLRANLDRLEAQNAALRAENAHLKGEVEGLARKVGTREAELEELKSESDKVVGLYRTLNGDLKRECRVYLAKIRELTGDPGFEAALPFHGSETGEGFAWSEAQASSSPREPRAPKNLFENSLVAEGAKCRRQGARLMNRRARVGPQEFSRGVRRGPKRRFCGARAPNALRFDFLERRRRIRLFQAKPERRRKGVL